MIVKLTTLLESGSGGLDKNHYMVPCPWRPGYVIIKQKPGPHDEPGTRKERRWKMPENQANGVNQFKAYQAIASAEYKDPEKRKVWEEEYKAWVEREKKCDRSGTELNGHIVRFLWDYIRIRIKEREIAG